MRNQAGVPPVSGIPINLRGTGGIKLRNHDAFTYVPFSFQCMVSSWKQESLYQPVPFLWERMLLLLIFPVSDSYKSIDLVLISASLVQRKILRHYP